MRKLFLFAVAIFMAFAFTFTATTGPAEAANNAGIFDNPITTRLIVAAPAGFGTNVLVNDIAGRTTNGKANSAGFGIGFGSGVAVTVVNCIAQKCDGAQFLKGTAVRGPIYAGSAVLAANVKGSASEVGAGFIGMGFGIVAEWIFSVTE